MTDMIFENPDLSLWILLSRAYRSLRHFRRREIAKCGLSIEQAGVLTVIKYLGNYAKPIDIAREMLRAPQTIAPIIDILLKKGLIETTRDKQRKNIVRISLTAKGEEVYKCSLKMGAIGDVLASLTEPERRNLREVLEKIIDESHRYRVSEDEAEFDYDERQYILN